MLKGNSGERFPQDGRIFPVTQMHITPQISAVSSSKNYSIYVYICNARNWILVGYTNSEYATVRKFGQESIGYKFLASDSNRETDRVLPGKFNSPIQILLTTSICIYVCICVYACACASACVRLWIASHKYAPTGLFMSEDVSYEYCDCNQ